jgi:hypothetical protein
MSAACFQYSSVIFRRLAEVTVNVHKITTRMGKGKSMKRVLGSLTVCLLGASAWAAAPVQWSAGSGGNDHYYQVVAAPGVSWADDRVAALGMEYDGLVGHLATITSQGELDFVNTVINANRLGEMYVGGYQIPESETNPQAGWTWVNGEGSFPGYNSTTPFANWNPGEPNDAYGLGSEQWLGLNWAAGAFNDEGNLGNIAGYVIEYDPTTINDVPDAGTTAPLFCGALAMLAMFSRRLRK